MPEVPANPRQDREAGLSATRLGGRFVSKYDPTLALRICERVSEGETLASICAAGSGLPCRQTFYRWAVNFPELARAYATARELSGHSLEEEALDMARHIRDTRTLHEPATVRAYDVAMGQLRWSASKRNPRIYSERAAMTFTVPIQINTTIDLAGGGGGTPDHPNVYEVEAKLVEPHEEDRPPPTDDSTPLVAPASKPRGRAAGKRKLRGTRTGRAAGARAGAGSKLRKKPTAKPAAKPVTSS